MLENRHVRANGSEIVELNSAVAADCTVGHILYSSSTLFAAKNGFVKYCGLTMNTRICCNSVDASGKESSSCGELLQMIK
jgi:hypothetical protein